MDHADAVRFHYGVRVFLIGTNAVTDVESADFTQHVSNLTAEFWQAVGQVEFANVDSALEAFRNWYIEEPNNRKEVKEVATVTVNITKHYGAVSVSFGLSNDVEIKKGSDYFTERAKLQALVEHEFLEYEKNHLPKQKSPTPQEENQFKKGATIQTIKLDRISMKVDDGRVMFRAHGGQFSKWGVPVYGEVLTAAGYDPDNFPLSGIDFDSAEMEVELEAGKPKRVLSIGVAF